MPNTPVWGNDTETQAGDQDLITVEESGSVILVNDVNNANDAKIAAHFINSSTNANARALKVEGKSEFCGEVLISCVALR